MIRRPQVNRRNRRTVSKYNEPTGAYAVSTNSIVATKWRLTLSVPVVVNGGVSAFAGFTVQGAAPTSVTVVSPTQIDLGYGAAVVAGNAGVIPPTAACLRTYSGGYVAAAAFTF